ncbi:MAG: DUF424 domain-containing protein [Nitrososphaerales archaeon]
MNHRFAVRRTDYQGSVMVNICDEELVGSKVSEGKLEVNITKNYFGEQIVDESEVVELLRLCSIANLVGERIVGKAVGMKLASELGVRLIAGVPFLMIFKFRH